VESSQDEAQAVTELLFFFLPTSLSASVLTSLYPELYSSMYQTFTIVIKLH
jgi:hypothetical protein